MLSRGAASSFAALLSLGWVASCEAFEGSSAPPPAAGDAASPVADGAPSVDGGAGDGPSGGDGGVAPDGAGDAAVGRVVFVTSAELAPDFGAAAGAAAACAADAAGRFPGATWTAWLGIAGTPSVGERVGLTVGPWRLPSGAPVAATTQDLVASNLLAAIDEDASGTKVAPSDVWTGVKSDGSANLANHCDNFQSLEAIYLATFGRTDKKDSGWMFNVPAKSCATKGRLYCLQR